MKKFILVILFFIFINFVSALEECKGTMPTDDVPCYVLLPSNQTTSPCENISVLFYNETTLLYNLSLDSYNSFLCNATFNQSSLGTYTFYYSTGDSGSIIIERGIKMIYLLYFAIILIAMLFILGMVKEDYTFLGLGGISAMVFGLFIFINGFDGINNLITQTVSMVGMLGGFYVMIGSIFEYSDLARS